jgi:hypothetical protein
MESLTATEIAALREALDDEYRAWATYDRVIADFGAAPPFDNIREAEARHIEALQGLFARYGLTVPENPWPGFVTGYPGLQEACKAGVQAEIENAALYERLLASTERADILAVFRNLRDASQQNHLPAFRRCAEREPQRGGRRKGGWYRRGRRRGS